MLRELCALTSGGEGPAAVCPVRHEDGDGGQLPVGRHSEGGPCHNRRLPGGR